MSDNPYDQFDAAADPVVTLGASVREIPRQLGLTARYGLEAFGQTALPDLLQLPAPRTPTERVVGTAAKTLIGAGAISKGAQFASRVLSPTIAHIGRVLAANNAGQASAAIGSGVGGGSVAEAGGGPTEQFIAAVLGGIAGYGVGAVTQRAASSAANAARKLVAPRDIQSVVAVELQRRGIDWNALSAQAKASLVRDAESALSAGNLDNDALARLAHFRSIGATPLRGDVTMNASDVTLQRNLAKTQANQRFPSGPNLAEIQQDNARRVLSTIEGIEHPATAAEAGTAAQSVIAGKDAAYRTAENELYRQARASAGRDLPLDSRGFVDRAFANLTANNRAPWLPETVKQVLNTLSRGDGSFTVDTIDQLKTLLAQESRATANGNTKAALSAVRQALDDITLSVRAPQTGSAMPMTGDMAARLQQAQGVADDLGAATLGKFDAARATARERRTWQESGRFIEDALEGMDPERWSRLHVDRATLGDLTKLRAELGTANPQAIAATRRQFVNLIIDRGRADTEVGKFSGAAMERAIEQIGLPKLKLFFSQDELQQLRSAIKVAKFMQAQPIGSAVNNSNSGAMVVGKVLDSILGAGSHVPVIGPAVTGARVAIQARSAANVPNALLLPEAAQPFPVSPFAAIAALPRSDQ